MSTRSRTLAMVLLIVLGMALAGCSNSTSPTAPDTGSQSTDPTIPPIPKPTSPQNDAPMESTTLTVIKPLLSSFYPNVVSLRSFFTVKGRVRWQFPPACDGAWISLYFGKSWSDELPVEYPSFPSCESRTSPTGAVHLAMSGWKHVHLLADGVPVQGSIKDETSKTLETKGVDYVELDYRYALAQLTETPYLRRDRQWVRVRLTDGSTSVLLAPNTQASFSTTETSGIDVEKSRSFSETVTGSAGLDADGVSASIQDAVTRSFSTTTSISQSTSTTTTHTVTGVDGKETVFMLWELDETYTITDENGDPFTDPSFTFGPTDPVVVRGVTFALDATTFDL